MEVDLHTARGNGRAKEEAWLPPPLQQVGLGPADPVSLGQVASGLRCPAGLPPASMKPWSCGMETKPGTWAKVRGEMGGGEIPLSKASGGVGSPHPWGKTNAGRRGQRKEEGNCTSDRMKLPLSGEAEGRLGGGWCPLGGHPLPVLPGRNSVCPLLGVGHPSLCLALLHALGGQSLLLTPPLNAGCLSPRGVEGRGAHQQDNRPSPD